MTHCVAVLSEGMVVITTALFVGFHRQAADTELWPLGAQDKFSKGSDVRVLANSTQNQLSPGEITKEKTLWEEFNTPQKDPDLKAVGVRAFIKHMPSEWRGRNRERQQHLDSVPGLGQ